MRIASRNSVGFVFIIVSGIMAVAGAWHPSVAADNSEADSATALTGTVTSDAEGPMEGVVVKAKRVGGTITISVVSDNHGRYAFPAERLKPGEYTLAIRATGYDIPKPTVTIGDKTATADLKLNKVGTFALADQLTPAEWIMSAPPSGSTAISISDCGSCHNTTVLFKSTYDVDGWMATLVRMRNYERGATFAHPTTNPYPSGPEPRDGEFAKYLASINMSAKPQWDFELKGFPRPKGKSTKVVYTEFDLPRPDAEPHDAVIDSDGMIWYDDFNRPIFGRLDPRTGETKEWPLPEMRPGQAPGSLNVAMDAKGNFWIARKFQASVAMFDRKTEKVTTYSLPKEDTNPYTLTTFVAVGGPNQTVCFDDTQNRRVYILDPATGKITGYDAYPGWKFDRDTGQGSDGVPHNMYGVSVSSKGLCYWSDIGNRNIGELDPATGKITLYPTPTAMSNPRRENITPDDQIWFGENNLGAQKIAVFDTKTKQFKEWEDRPVDPYDAIIDKSGHVWSGGEPTDFVTRLDPNTGEMVQYLLPNVNVDIRRVYVDNFTSPPSMLIGENHRAKIVLVQPME